MARNKQSARGESIGSLLLMAERLEQEGWPRASAVRAAEYAMNGRGGKYDYIDFSPPKGLERRKEHGRNKDCALGTWAAAKSGKRRSGGTEFSSQEALNNYLRQHPGADVSKHSVKQTEPVANTASHVELPSGIRVAASRPATDISTKQAKKDGERIGGLTAMSAKSLETSGTRLAQDGRVGAAARDFYAAALRHGADGKMTAAKRAFDTYKELVAHAAANPRPSKE